ncbi:MAG: hypothetical protein P8Z37_05870 [Acidobacteriota bacterium]
MKSGTMASSRLTKSLTIPREDSGLSPSSIQKQTERILKSPEFDATDAQRAFLRYVVEKTLSGQADEIKGYAVATEVFGRREDFDQATDPVVSIQANKLRRALERYYLVAGQNDRILIDIPKGTYIPTFEAQSNLTDAAASTDYRKFEARAKDSWPSLLVHPFDNLSGNSKLDQMTVVVAMEIAAEITNRGGIHVFLKQSESGAAPAFDTAPRFELKGSISKDLKGFFKVRQFLTDLSTGRQIWADTCRVELNIARLMPIAEQIARQVACKISSEYGIIARQLSNESKHVPSLQLTTYEAILRYLEFSNDFTRSSFFDAVEALRHACQNEPESGLAWSMLSRIYSVNYATELFEMNTPIDDAIRFAHTGVILEPDRQRTRASLAYALMIADEIPAAISEVERALAQNPESLIFLDLLGYLLTLLGDWKRGPALIRKAIETNPYYNMVVHHALWLDLFRRRSYDKAYQETLNFKYRELFWDHLARAATLGQMGRIEEGRHAADKLLKLKPDFARRGRILISRYVKFDEIVERLIDGLNRVGVDCTGTDAAK